MWKLFEGGKKMESNFMSLFVTVSAFAEVVFMVGLFLCILAGIHQLYVRLTTGKWYPIKW
jgi:hypothetical protein